MLRLGLDPWRVIGSFPLAILVAIILPIFFGYLVQCSVASSLFYFNQADTLYQTFLFWKPNVNDIDIAEVTLT